MRRDARKWLEDIVTHGEEATKFVSGHMEEEYVVDRQLCAAVERKLFIVGEAVTQLTNQFPDIAKQLPDAREIVSFRNFLAQGYFAIDQSRVFDSTRDSLPERIDAVR